ncbi:putative lipase YDL109C [Monosporozyma servazzii]
MNKVDKNVWFHYKSSLKVGECERFIIKYDLYEDDVIPDDIILDSLWLRIKNMEPLSYRAGYLMGPFILYADLRSENYHHSQKIIASADQPKFEPNLQPQQQKITELPVHRIQKQYTWVVDVVSQILFATTSKVSFELSVSATKASIESKFVDILPSLATYSKKLQVTRLTTLDLWKLPPQLSIQSHEKKPKHLVILTHGLHSNITTDMEYIQEQIYKAQDKYPDEHLIVEGFPDNVCQTEKGVKYLGTRVAEYIVSNLYDDNTKKISFIGHSLGGLVQTFAIAYISIKYPWFFQNVEPINFITMASPLLGIVTDNPAYIKLLLSFGVIGKTGQDLGLDKNSNDNEALLYLLPGDPVRTILSKFKRRTLYANVVNDGIVPLYTASLLFLDYDEILRTLREITDKSISTENVTISDNAKFFSRNFVNPFTKMIGLLAPQRFPTEEDSKLPKVSIFESATSVLIPPLPDKAYIMDPDSREPCIIHDKVYTEDDIPPQAEVEDNIYNSTNILLQPFTIEKRERAKYQKLEESIARRWHKGLSWRKVVVKLKPDAHNNIIARRRFANAYGWPVIDHLIDNHFNGEETPNNEQSDQLPHSSDCEEQITIPSNYEWVTRRDEESIFDVGPTGMISTMSDLLESFTQRKTMHNSKVDSDLKDEILKYEELNNNSLP